jgi:hypothetical protein
VTISRRQFLALCGVALLVAPLGGTGCRRVARQGARSERRGERTSYENREGGKRGHRRGWARLRLREDPAAALAEAVLTLGSLLPGLRLANLDMNFWGFHTSREFVNSVAKRLPRRLPWHCSLCGITPS